MSIFDVFRRNPLKSKDYSSVVSFALREQAKHHVKYYEHIRAKTERDRKFRYPHPDSYVAKEPDPPPQRGPQGPRFDSDESS